MAGPDDSEGGDVSSSDVSNGVSMVEEEGVQGTLRFAFFARSCYCVLL
jgi:hypothetical protein